MKLPPERDGLRLSRIEAALIGLPEPLQRLRALVRALDANFDLLRNRDRRLGAWVTPATSLREALDRGYAGGSDPDTYTLRLGEGTWDVHSALTVSRSKVRIVGSGPGTVIRRQFTGTGTLLTLAGTDLSIESCRLVDANASSATSGPLVAITGTRGRLIDCDLERDAAGDPLVSITATRGEVVRCRIDDSTSVAAAIKVTGSEGLVAQCYFVDCGRSVEVNGCNFVRVQGNHIAAHRDSTYGMFLTGTCNRLSIQGNVFETNVTGSNSNIRADSSVDWSAFTGNVGGQTDITLGYVVDYPFMGTENVDIGNVGAINAR